MGESGSLQEVSCSLHLQESVFILFCVFYIRWRPIKASDELVGETHIRRMQVDTRQGP
jgi:hypothetical protein